MVCNLVKFQVFFIGFIIQLGLSSSYCHYGEIRLTMENRGRLEICINDEWGTVCPNLWRTTYGRTPNGIANVVCRQLGYSTIAAKYYPLAYYGRGSGRIWLHNVFCTGSESALLNCSHSGIGVQSPYNCDHSEDVSVYCLPKRNTNNGAIILSRNNISSTAYHYGVVRAYYDGWGNICNGGYYGLAEADVICHQLGYTGASSYSNAGQNNYGTDYLQSRLGYLYCRNRNYLSIAQCSYSRNLNDCTHSNDVAVNCYVNRIWNSNPYPGMIRLQGGPHSNIGHVQVYCNGHWGAVCSNGFDNDDADTVCKQLGYDFSFNYGSSVLSAMAFTWSTNMSSTYNDTCFSSSNDCLNHSMTSCSSFATVSCYDESLEISRTATNVTCSLPQDVPTGTIILSRNGVSSVSYYYGIVRVFDNDGWGNIM